VSLSAVRCNEAGTKLTFRGEELGLPEVVTMPDDKRQDPTFFRTKDTPNAEIGRDGCRVPLPWTKEGTNFGFGSGKPAHLPQPDWMGKYSVEALDKSEDSTLNLYRKTLNLRKKLQTKEELEWVESGDEVLHFKRPGGWEVVMNFGSEPVEVPKGELLIASEELKDGKIGQDVSVWVKSA
jgi:alpha-glucosidase